MRRMLVAARLHYKKADVHRAARHQNVKPPDLGLGAHVGSPGLLSPCLCALDPNRLLARNKAFYDEMVKGVSESKGKPMTVTKSHANVSRQQLSTCCKEHQRA